MLAVVSLLDEEHSQKVKSLIDQIDEHFGLTGVQMTPFPHITWLLTEIQDNDEALLQQCLQQTAAVAAPFTIQTTGLGIFTGEHPVLSPASRRALARTAQLAPPYAGKRYSDWRPYSLTK
ncbi:MAG: 2'-5' RNA ligase family protein [Adhaeribacter sp.]